MPRKYIPPEYKYPCIVEVCALSLKRAQQHVVYGKHWIKQTPSLQDFSLRLIIPPPPPPKVSTAQKISTCSVANPENTYVLIKVARNEVKNASFAQRSAHRDSRIWRPELIEPAAERKRRARRRRRTFKSPYSDL